MQGTALRLVLLLSDELGLELIAKRLFDRPSGAALATPAERRDFLVRRQCVELLAGGDERASGLLRRALVEGDPSEHVRQGLAEAFARRGALPELARLAGLDPRAPEPSPRVRAVALQAACRSATPATLPAVVQLVVAALDRETAALPLSIACEDLALLMTRASSLAAPDARSDISREAPPPALVEPLLASLLRLASHPERPPAIQEIAAAAAERVGRMQSPEGRAWTHFFETFTRRIEPGTSRSISLAELADLPPLPADPTFLGRILAELSRRDFPLFAARNGGRLVVWRGDRYRRRLWRVLHELRSRRPNKRQAHRHTVGRVMKGHLRAPPGGLDEVTATTVPGERVHVSEEGGWGRHLPSVDDLLDLPLLSRDPVHVFSSHGVTTIHPPAGLWARLRNRLALSVRYEALAALRLQSLRGTEPHTRQRFAEQLRETYGIQLTFARYDYAGHRALAPARLAALFAATPLLEAASSTVLAAPSLDGARDWLAHQGDYFLSLRQNGQLALALFLVAFAVLFFVGAYRKRARIARARARIPLTIGGWGTRGKSGTERLKAALFHGLGYEISVKTTGCEAMLIHSVPDEPPHEIFIFRSYDKATIWEQRDVVETAADLRSEVFLWECMALQPEFVELLQHDWMRDDYVTLTNAFPDHEDVQGPAGADVAECITSFIPHDSTLVTSEVNFLPLFEQRARERGTQLHPVAPRDGDLIAEDLLALFPYNEHPRNIALVARLAEELGVDRHLAIATMAEHVVPDLGVLKTYPPAVRARPRRSASSTACPRTSAPASSTTGSAWPSIARTPTPTRTRP